MLEADVRMRRGRAMPNNTGIKGTWDGGVKKEVDRTSDEKKKKHSSS